MKRWHRIALIAGLLIALTAAGLYEASTHVIRGWLRGEAFYDGRPTSWWRGELERWTTRGVANGNIITFGPPSMSYLYSRNDTWFEKQVTEWFPKTKSGEEELNAIIQRLSGPRLLRGNDDAAIPVLRELLDDPSARMRRFAQIGLKLKVEHSEDDE